LTHEAHRLETIHPRHKYINDKQIELFGLEQPQSRPAIVNRLDGMTIALKQDSDGGQYRSIIINDENARHGFLSDSARLNQRLHIC
jgi:hypothetical protein